MKDYRSKKIRLSTAFFAFVSCALLLSTSLSWAKGSYPEKHFEVYSDVFTINDKFKSMQGPSKRVKLLISEEKDSELLWITGYKVELVAPDKTPSVSQDYICHSNMDISMEKHTKIFEWDKFPSDRLFTLSGGHTTVAFEKGFGIPIMSDEAMNVTNQLLNHTEDGVTIKVRFKMTLSYVKDKDLKNIPMTPLYMQAVQGLVLIEGENGYYGMKGDHKHEHGHDHGKGAESPKGELADGSGLYNDRYGKKFAGHWVVKPGREVNRTNVTKFLGLHDNTRIHHIVVHVHPFAESVELVDLTTSETLFKSHIKTDAKKIRLEKIDHFSGKDGIKIDKSHQYELISVYNNLSPANQTAMSVMYLYMQDNEFNKKGNFFQSLLNLF